MIYLSFTIIHGKVFILLNFRYRISSCIANIAERLPNVGHDKLDKARYDSEMVQSWYYDF